jgi:C4-type Zn-finger protein
MVYYKGFFFPDPSMLSVETQRAIRNGTRCPKCGTEDTKDHVHQKRLPVTANSTSVDAEFECWSCGYKWPCYPVRA